MAKTVKITAGQPFTVFVPLVILNADGTKEAVEANTLTDVSVKAQNGAREYTVPANTYDRYLVLQVSKNLLPVGVYDLIITATLQSGRAFRLAMQEAIGVMSWDWQTNWRDYLVGEHIELCDQPFIAGEFMTDAELEALKQQLREQIAAAEQAEAEAIAEKERYAEAIEHLDDIAQESTLTHGVSDIRHDIANIDIDIPSDYAKETTAQQAATDAAAAKTAAQGITGYATEANATANKNAIIAEIQANAGIPTLTIPDSTAAQELAPNVLYIFATRTSTLTLTLGTPIVGIANEYHFFIVCGSTAPTVNFPAGITWNGGSAPTIAADKTYEVSILNNVAAYFEV